MHSGLSCALRCVRGLGFDEIGDCSTYVSSILGEIMRRARIVGTGAYLPEEILTNHDLVAFAKMEMDQDRWGGVSELA